MFKTLLDCYTVDCFALLMILLISFIGICTISFSLRYMQGNIQYRSFFIKMVLLIGSLLGMAASKTLFIFLLFSSTSTVCTLLLLRPTTSWQEAKKSWLMSAKQYAAGILCTTLGIVLLYYQAHSVHMKNIIDHSDNIFLTYTALTICMLATLLQTGAWPFHRLLHSFIPTPTPVLAFVHSCVINSGFILLIRLAPLYIQYPYFLTTLQLVGLVSIIIGTFFSLIQHNTRLKMTYSTLTYIGAFYFLYGLGLISLAVTYLVCYSLHTLYLILNSNTINPTQPVTKKAVTPTLVCTSLLVTMSALYMCTQFLPMRLCTNDTTLFILIFAGGMFHEIAFTLLRTTSLWRVCIIIAIATVLYAYTIHTITYCLKPMNLWHPQPLNIVHIGSMGILIGSVILIRLLPYLYKQHNTSSWLAQAYVIALNYSQPNISMITTHRNDYK